jgi:hypothetical protein
MREGLNCSLMSFYPITNFLHIRVFVESFVLTRRQCIAHKPPQLDTPRHIHARADVYEVAPDIGARHHHVRGGFDPHTHDVVRRVSPQRHGAVQLRPDPLHIPDIWVHAQQHLQVDKSK